MSIRPRPLRALRSISLQARFALLAAVTVSVAVLGAVLICYFLVAGQLNNQIDANLARQAAGIGHPSPQGGPFQLFGGSAFGSGQTAGTGSGGTTSSPTGGSLDAAGIMATCDQSPSSSSDADRVSVLVDAELVSSTGKQCSSGGSGSYSVAVSATQRAVADDSQNDVYYDTYTTDTEHVRVYTVQVPGQPGYALSYFSSLANRDSSLETLAAELVLAAIAGIGIALVAGFLVARSALRPVRRLTRAVEYVAATENLAARLPVTGKDEINRLGASFNKMTRALALSGDRQRRLIVDAGHELRTPLTSLRTNVDLLLRSERTGRPLPEGRRESMLVSVDQQLHELSGLVTDLLELSRGAEGGVRRTMPVALHESVGRAVERARLRGPGLTFNVEIETWTVRGDPTGIDRAVVNLLDNAVKFSPAGGTVTVRLSAGQYTVADQGPGIEPADLPRVFERFWRSDSARALPGSGLGLAIVAQVAEESGGTVALEAAPGGGTLARLNLPGQAT
jgi:two-component system, OmpR family, sensor histidine kinase MprB